MHCHMQEWLKCDRIAKVDIPMIFATIKIDPPELGGYVRESDSHICELGVEYLLVRLSASLGREGLLGLPTQNRATVILRGFKNKNTLLTDESLPTSMDTLQNG